MKTQKITYIKFQMTVWWISTLPSCPPGDDTWVHFPKTYIVLSIGAHCCRQWSFPHGTTRSSVHWEKKYWCAIQPLLHTISILFLSCDLQMIQENHRYLMNISLWIFHCLWRLRKEEATSADQNKPHVWSVRLQRARQAEFTPIK